MPFHVCIICGLFSRQYVCEVCKNNLIPSRVKSLQNQEDNNQLLSANISSPQKFMTCMTVLSIQKLRFIDAVYSSYSYAFPLNKILHAFKYNRDRYLAWSLGYLLYPAIKKMDKSPDMFIPMPLHKNRYHERGFNQAQLLLNYYLAIDADIPIYTHIVKRVADTKTQVTRVNALERELNIMNAFQLNVPASYIENRHIVIIDDVVTTGSSVNELAKLLKLHGAKRVDVCALLVTQNYFCTNYDV